MGRGGSAPADAGDASHRLVETSNRHKRQVETVTRDTARWQNDMHLKLSKLSMMCKELNDESAQRREESLGAAAESARVRSEHNAAAAEIETLRARLEQYERQEAENDQKAAARAAASTEDGGATATLDRADEALRRRDAIIVELSGRLRRTADTLEAERQLQRQRRQIIFPRTRSQSYNTHQQAGRSSSSASFFGDLSLSLPPKAETPPPPGSGAAEADDSFAAVDRGGGNPPPPTQNSAWKLNEQLVRAREEARTARADLDVAQSESLRRERELRERCQLLERELWDPGNSRRKSQSS